MQKKDSNNLLEPVAAVESYLDNLLQEEEAPEPPPVAVTERKVVTLPGVRPLDELLAEPLAEVVERAAPQPAADPIPELSKPQAPAEENAPLAAELEAPEPVEPESAVGTRDDTARDAAAAGVDDPRSRYAYPVQCLMFRVDRHQLCIPLIDMGSVAPLDPHRLTHLPHTPEWLMGVLPHRDQNLRIVDSAVLLGIERQQTTPEQLHFLVFADEDFAITCDALGEVVYLQDEDIKWQPSGAPGLSMGTVRDSLATLLSPGAIVGHMQQLSKAD